MVFLGTNCIVHRILVDVRAEGELDAPSFPLHTFQRIQNLELAGIAVSGALRGNGGNVPIVHIHDSGSFGDRCGICKEYFHRIITDPCFAPEGKNLLFILFAVNGDLISRIPIRCAGNLRRQHLRPSRPSGVDVLGRGEHFLGALQLHSGQRGIDLEVVNIPVTQEVTPEGHLRGIITLIFVFKAKFLQRTGGIAAGHNSQHLGI